MSAANGSGGTAPSQEESNQETLKELESAIQADGYAKVLNEVMNDVWPAL